MLHNAWSAHCKNHFEKKAKRNDKEEEEEEKHKKSCNYKSARCKTKQSRLDVVI